MTAEGIQRSTLTHRDRFLELIRQPPSTKEAKNLAARLAIVEYTNTETSPDESKRVANHLPSCTSTLNNRYWPIINSRISSPA
jgi:hypothetical protein